MTERMMDEIELERYELNEGAAYHFEMHRRDFFKTLGGGILIVFAIKDALAVQESGGGQRPQSGSLPKEIGAWLHIGEDGAVTVYTGKVEFGQDIRTSLAQAVAEELRAPLASIRLVMGDTDLTPYDMGTFGSRTTPTMNPQLRKAAAAARESLITLAAEQLKVEPASLVVADGKLLHPPTKRSLSFGQLTKGQRLLKTITDNVQLTPPDQWKVAGRAAPKANGREIVTGKHQYTSDMKLTGMLLGKVLRPASFGATLVSFDARDAEKLEGVTVTRDGDFVGVAARNQQTASRALAALRAEWKTTPQISTKELFAHLKKQTAASEGGEGRSNYSRGSVAEGMAAANQKLERAYTVAYIAHAPLEPRAAVAEWKDGRLTVWTGTQRPFGVRTELADAFHIPQTQVRVIVPDTGSGYGGKHTGEVALEAARLAKAAGKPVKVVWSREEEFNWAYFRPAGVIEIKSGATKDGIITAWEFHNYNSGSSGIRTLYDIANQQIEFHATHSPLRQGSYRGLAATANHFAREVHIDELAESLKIDPLEFRLKNLKDKRIRDVLEAVARRFDWGKARKEDRGFGIACGFEKGGYVASCAEVSINPASDKIKLVRVVTAFECGAIVNPDGLKNQVEGAVIQSIGGAMFEAIEFENGKVLNSRFSRYRVPRFSDVPILETILLDRKDLPSAGAGETPIVGLAPAISNAIFSATGIRLRSLPMMPNGLKQETNSEEIKSK
ncbi:MAG TPA: molybdopterin cofactor-binding domain-containing protein [Blastocatellia bacterium]|nr:molybdopterin cofactor-binding domain-containing protein [Blastocatellia bacterium]